MAKAAKEPLYVMNVVQIILVGKGNVRLAMRGIQLQKFVLQLRHSSRNERFSGFAGDAKGVSRVQKLSDISLEALPRFSTGFKEFDRVLGGGVVPGSAILIGEVPERVKVRYCYKLCVV